MENRGTTYVVPYSAEGSLLRYNANYVPSPSPRLVYRQVGSA